MRKGPDFKSRLQAYLDVRGPNPRQLYDARAEDWIEDDPDDVCFPIRRALFIRAKLGLEPDETLEIDGGVLSALLEVGRYRHGARSLERIVLHIRDHRVDGFVGPASLPPADRLQQDVDRDDFMRIVTREDQFRALAPQLARLVHEYYLPYAEHDSPYNVPFEQLPDEIQEDNRVAGERLIRVLALAGLRVVPGSDSSEDASARAAELIEEHLELLAEEEHIGWMDQRLRNGWTFARERNDELKQHPSLLPYVDLPSKEKDKDRNSVRRYPDIVRAGGYKIVRAGVTPARRGS